MAASRKLTVLPWTARWTLPAQGGVYVIHGPDRVAYVGITNDLRSRLRSHHHQRAFDGLAGAHVGYLLVADETERRAIERDLIKQHRPPLNRVGNPSHPSRLMDPVMITITVERSMLAQIDDYFFSRRCGKRVVAIRTLLAWALDNDPP